MERISFVLNHLEMVTFERSAVGQIAHTLHVIAANAVPELTSAHDSPRHLRIE
jgi:hypothetical protein